MAETGTAVQDGLREELDQILEDADDGQLARMIEAARTCYGGGKSELGKAADAEDDETGPHDDDGKGNGKSETDLALCARHTGETVVKMLEHCIERTNKETERIIRESEPPKPDESVAHKAACFTLDIMEVFERVLPVLDAIYKLANTDGWDEELTLSNADRTSITAMANSVHQALEPLQAPAESLNSTFCDVHAREKMQVA